MLHSPKIYKIKQLVKFLETSNTLLNDIYILHIFNTSASLSKNKRSTVVPQVFRDRQNVVERDLLVTYYTFSN